MLQIIFEEILESFIELISDELSPSLGYTLLSARPVGRQVGVHVLQDIA